MAYDIVLLPGDGIGIEVAAEARALLELVAESTGVELRIDEIPCGGKYYLDHGRDWPEGSEDKCRSASAILLGAVGYPDPSGSGPVTMKDGRMAGYSPVIGNRMHLDLYANVRPVKLLPGVKHSISGKKTSVWSPDKVDMIFIRENTEGMYSGMGGVMQVRGQRSIATDVRVITRAASERVIRYAFELSRAREHGAPKDGRKRVTCIVKNNVLDGCRLFTEVYREIATEYGDVDTDIAIVDAFTQWLITEPERYDVCVTTNMFGDIVTDLASVLQGGMGMAVGCNLGDDHAMFEPIHGSAPPLAGQDKANPMAMLLAAGEMLGWLGRRHGDKALRRAHIAIEKAVADICAAGAPLPADLSDRPAPMSVVARAVRDRVAASLA